MKVQLGWFLVSTFLWEGANLHIPQYTVLMYYIITSKQSVSVLLIFDSFLPIIQSYGEQHVKLTNSTIAYVNYSEKNMDGSHFINNTVHKVINALL